MTDRDQTKDEQRARAESGADGDRAAQRPQTSRGQDVMHGRSFAGANIANTEKEQTRDRQRIADHEGETVDEAGESQFVTDAEIEARENNED